MSLRNAFDELGLESTLRKILAAVTYSRTSADQMRVVVDSGSIGLLNSSVIIYNASTAVQPAAGGIPFYYSNASWNSVDARETMRESSELHFVFTRNRWTIT